MKRYQGQFAHYTDRGRVRVTNEDQANVVANEAGDILLIVCDGMGGQKKGDLASKTAIDFICEAFQEKKKILLPRAFFNSAIHKANSLIFKMAEENPAYDKMGTTLVAVLIQGNKMHIANIGDSRAYAYSRASGLARLTHDQTYVDYLARTGQIKQEEKANHPDRHILTNALGTFATASFDYEAKPYAGESILLCSDGLYNNLSDAEIRAVLSTDDRPDQKARSLIIDANANGGSDNIGVAYWECLHD